MVNTADIEMRLNKNIGVLLPMAMFSAIWWKTPSALSK